MAAIFVVWVVLGCSKLDPQDNPIPEITGEKIEVVRRNFKVTQKDALQVALEIPSRFSPDTKSGARTVLNSFAILDKTPKKSRSAQVDTLVYVVNFADDKGYVFVSPDTRSGEILAYFENGNFELADTVGNPGVAFMVDLILEHQSVQLNELISMPNDTPVAYGIAGAPGMPGQQGSVRIASDETFVGIEGNRQAIEGMRRKYPNLAQNGYLGMPAEPPIPPQPDFPLGPPGPENPEQLFDYAQYYATKGCTYITSFRREKHGYKKPMLVTQWSQYSPLNGYVDILLGARPPVGCGPLAAAQIMVYHKFPSRIPNKNNLKFRNEEIYIAQLDAYIKNINLSGAPVDVKNGAAKLLRALGDAMDVLYTDAFGTGVPSLALSGGTKIIDAFKMFGYSVPQGFYSYSAGNMAILRKSLDEGKPVFVYGFSNKVHSKGHVWVIDGYQDDYDFTHHKRYLFDETGTFNKEGSGSIASAKDDRFVHCNMGNGANKTYVTNEAVNNSSVDCWFNGYVFDRSSNGGGNYRYNVRFLPGITKP